MDVSTSSIAFSSGHDSLFFGEEYEASTQENPIFFDKPRESLENEKVDSLNLANGNVGDLLVLDEPRDAKSDEIENKKRETTVQPIESLDLANGNVGNSLVLDEPRDAKSDEIENKKRETTVQPIESLDLANGNVGNSLVLDEPRDAKSDEIENKKRETTVQPIESLDLANGNVGNSLVLDEPRDTKCEPTVQPSKSLNVGESAPGSSNRKRKRERKGWYLIQNEEQISNEDWLNIYDVQTKRFIKETYIKFFSSKLLKITQCKVICYGHYAGTNTWTVEFRCKECKCKYKYSSKVEKQFQLKSIGFDTKCGSN